MPTTQLIMTQLPMTQLIMTIGVPGSGKSTLVQRWEQEQPSLILISTDQIRAKLFGDAAIQGSWQLIQTEIRQQFRVAVNQIRAGRSDLAVYDATNARRRNRRDLLALARNTGFTHITAVWLNPPLSLCLQRNRARSRQVPEFVIQRMHRQLWSSPPRLREGLNRLLHYGTSAPNREDVLKLSHVRDAHAAPAACTCNACNTCNTYDK